MKELKNRGRQRWKDYICLFVSFLFVLYFGFNYKSIIYNSHTLGNGIKILVLAGLWAIGTVLIFVKLEVKEKTSRIINILYVLLSPCFIFLNMEAATFAMGKSFSGLNKSLLLFNIGFILILELICIVLTNRIRLGTDICAFICVMFNIANHFIYEFRGTPIIASDIATISTAAEVASSYEIKFNWYLLVTLLLLFDFFMVGRVIKCKPVFSKKKFRLCGIIAMAIISVVGVQQFILSDYLDNHGLKLSLFNPMRSYRTYGSIAGFSRSIHYSILKKPEGYSLEKVEEITSKYESDTVDKTKEHPNVIVVINEAFSDLKALSDFETNEDYMPFIHGLMNDKNCVSGTTYASIVGGQTANTEYEFLTGNSLAFLPTGAVAFQLFVKDAMPSLVTQLQDEEYMGSTAIHLHRASNYRRDRAYPLLGFKNFYNYDTVTTPIEKLRHYATDAGSYQRIIEDFESYKKDSDDPYLGYVMTVQNHSPFISRGDENYTQTISLKDIKAEDVETYLSLIKLSDDAFKDMVEYFKNVDEPTVIFMTGDHQPRINDASMNALTKGQYKNWNDEEMMRHRYAIPFMIWANYDIGGQKVEQTSMNYLQTLLMETTGNELTGFQKYQQDLQKEIPVLTGNGYVGADGKFYELNDETSPYYSLLQDYSILQYNDLVDTKNRDNDFFNLQK